MTLTPGLLALAPAVICGLGAVLVLLVDAVMTRSQAWQRALGAVVDVLAFIPGGPARVLLALALLTAATVSGAALLLRGSVRQTA